MRLRRFELRLIASLLATLWATAAGLILLGYRPGGPVDLAVGAVVAAAVVIPLAAVAWPPLARGPHAFAALAWLGIFAGLLLVPSIGGLVRQLVERGPQTLLPSAEAAYPWLLALILTATFAGLGIAGRLLGPTSRRRARGALGLALALVATAAVSGAFAAAAVANESGLRDRPIAGSRFGPTDPERVPPLCGGPIAVGSNAAIAIDVEGRVDGRSVGIVNLDGVRSGRDFRWWATTATARSLGAYGATRIGNRQWTRSPGTGWDATGTEEVTGLDLDAHLVRTALTAGRRATAEDRGLETIEGARARHCRVGLDGRSFAAAFPQVRWFTGPPADFHRWAGKLDYWIFLDGELGIARAEATGPASSIGDEGVVAELSVRLTATDREIAVAIGAPR